MPVIDPKDLPKYTTQSNPTPAPSYSPNARLQDGFNRGLALAKSGGARPVQGSKGYENSNLSTAYFTGYDSVARGGSGSGGGSKKKTTSLPVADTGFTPGLLPSAAESEPAPVAPTLPSLPALTMSKGASVENQLNRLQSLDSVPMQQAKIQAQELGAASGAIHSSQQAGAAQRAVQNAMTPIAQSEANLVGSTDIANWSTEVKRLTDIYEKEYAGYLSKLGIASNEKQAMMAASTSLSQSLLGSVTSLLGNPEIEFGPEVKNKLTSIYNSALKNNNTILDMGFTYA